MTVHDVTKYRVSKDRRHSEGHHRITLQVRTVQASDLGTYECSVINAIGSGQAHVQLVLVPEPPIYEGENINEPPTVITHWSIRSHQPLSEVVLSYKNEKVSWSGTSMFCQGKR